MLSFYFFKVYITLGLKNCTRKEMCFFAIHADFGTGERSECIHCGSQENDFRAFGTLGYRYKGIFLTRIDVCLIFSWLLDYDAKTLC